MDGMAGIPLNDAGHRTASVQGCLDELAELGTSTAAADPVVRALLARSAARLRMLCGRLLQRRYPRLTRGPVNLEADEVLSAVVERLLRAVRDVRPRTVEHFFALANLHIRWELNSLARSFDNRPAAVKLSEFTAAATPRDDSSNAGNPNARRIVVALAKLPEDEREALSLVRIQGLTYEKAAEALGVSTKTVQRRLNRSVARLRDAGLAPAAQSA